MTRTPEDTPLHRKLGYEHHREREAIRAHLVRRGHDPHSLAFEFRVTRIQDRIHRYKPSMRERQRQWREQQQKSSPAFDLTSEEIKYLREVFEAANHPIAQSIYSKARNFVGE